MKQKNILSLNHEQAMDFFMQSAQYHGFELPEYFVFDDVLQFVRERVGETPFEDCLSKNVRPENLADINLDILLNKDGKYAVRPIVLANPYLYYFTVRELCSESGWEVVKDLFTKFQVPHLSSCAIPIVPRKKESFYKSTSILNWWNSMEQRSIELSLEYRYMFVTDITNCYGSFIPQSLDWAFNLKGSKLEMSGNEQISKNIQQYLRAMQQGRNIGIPQGSAIFDFIGEIILGYSDLLLHEAIEKAGINVPYEILRYRDDYRIFCNDKGKLEQISYILQHVLESLNLRMNSQKTHMSDSLITDAIKPDKLYYLSNTPISRKFSIEIDDERHKTTVFDFNGLQKHLLYILMFGRKFPNCGQLKTMLSELDRRVQDKLKETRFIRINLELLIQSEKESKSLLDRMPIFEEVPGLFENVRAMSAICTQIALENVSASHYALRVISRMVDSLENAEEKQDIIRKVYDRLCDQPNSTYSQLWLQNITIKQDQKSGHSPYTMSLCRLAAGDDSVDIWNNEWMQPAFTEGLPKESVVNKDVLEKNDGVIKFRETRAYEEYFENE